MRGRKVLTYDVPAVILADRKNDGCCAGEDLHPAAEERSTYIARDCIVYFPGRRVQTHYVNDASAINQPGDLAYKSPNAHSVVPI